MRKLSEEEFTVFDLETTGGRPETNGILEIGLVKVKKKKICDQFRSLVNPEYPIPPIVQRMTGITPEMAEEAPHFHKISKQIIDFIDTDILVVHNSPFDLQFLNYHMRKLGEALFTNPILCTVKLGHLLLQEAPNRKLETLATYLDIPFPAPHRAWSDAEVTAKVFLVYLKILQEKGIETFPELFRFLKNGNNESKKTT